MYSYLILIIARNCDFIFSYNELISPHPHMGPLIWVHILSNFILNRLLLYEEKQVKGDNYFLSKKKKMEILCLKYFNLGKFDITAIFC